MMNVCRVFVFLAIVSDLSSSRCFATVTLDRTSIRLRTIKHRVRILTHQPVTESRNATENVTATSSPYDLDSERTTPPQPGGSAFSEWNETCHREAVFKIGPESFLNYLLRLRTCGFILGNEEQLQRACETRPYNFTEYYRVAYLRFCDRDLYNEVCREETTTKSHAVEPEKFENETSGDWENKIIAADDQKLLSIRQRGADFLQTEDTYMIRLACTNVEDFSFALEKKEFYKNGSQLFKMLAQFRNTVNDTLNGNSSLPTVVFSEWFNPIIPFCRPFTCGASWDRFHTEPASFYNCMPKNCRATVVFSIVFDAILAILTIVANSLVLGVAARTKIMRNIPGYFKISLALADLIVGVVVLPTCIFTTYTFYIGPLPFRHPGQIPKTTDYITRPTANFLGFFLVLSFALSIYTMGMASTDRYLAITKPFKYRQGQYLTKRRCAVMFAAIWLLGFVLALCPVFTKEPYSISAYNLLLSTGVSSSILYAIGLLIPLVAVWSLNGAMLSQVCADSEKRRSIRATGVLSAAVPPAPMRGGIASSSASGSAEDTEVGEKYTEVQPKHVPLKDREIVPEQPTNTPQPKQIVSRNISASSQYHKNDKRPSVPPVGEGIKRRLKRNRRKQSMPNADRNNLARKPSITNTAANVERRLARTLAIMIGAFTFALLPSIVVLVIYVFLSSDSSPTTHVRLATAMYISSRIILSNSFWNCIIYSIRNRHFRRAMWAIFLLKKEKINRRLRTSITMSNWKRRSALPSSSGSSAHDRQSLSKTSSTNSSAAMYQNKEHRRSTMMWSLASTSPSPSRKSSTDILESRSPVITRSVSHNVDFNANRSKHAVTRCESAPAAQDCKKFTIPTVNVELIEEDEVEEQ